MFLILHNLTCYYTLLSITRRSQVVRFEGLSIRQGNTILYFNLFYLEFINIAQSDLKISVILQLRFCYSQSFFIF